ncbi:MAG TPA: hypothetical protein VLT36_19740 [Candidatus Dormibacteraeota bacterium]|nr:hypothetical protein [Candidatus Dormibacteraeota bacterium]
MNFPQFWAKGTSGDYSIWKWSTESVADAQALADRAVREFAARFAKGKFPPPHRGYYPNQPLREQFLQEVKNDAGELLGLITRNSYGSQVLNTERVMFVDIDLPEPKPPPGFLKRLFGKPEPPGPNPQNAAITRIENWSRDNPEWGWRIYRTRSGLRLLATHSLIDSKSEATNRIFEALGADTLYQKLCKTQNCFRARLTPKPWRCGVFTKPERWPWLTPNQEERFRKWEAKYNTSSQEFATCHFVRHLGEPAVHPDVQGVVALHDQMTRIGTNLQLA